MNLFDNSERPRSSASTVVNNQYNVSNFNVITTEPFGSLVKGDQIVRFPAAPEVADQISSSPMSSRSIS